MKRLGLFALFLILVLATACAAPAAAPAATRPFTISAIPDQDPEKLQRLYGDLATYLQKELGVPVVYRPVTDYAASVTAFKVGDLDMVWYGGLTGVQARLEVPGAEAILQRDIDATFQSVFIANSSSGLEEITELAGLQALKGHTFTFGSDSSTSGRLMPQHFLTQAGVALTDFQGEPGFSGSHDKTIALVEAGSYEVGVLNAQVWESRTAAGEVDESKVKVIWRTPPYYDYHWVVRPDVAERFGADFVARVRAAFEKLDPAVPEHQAILDLFGAKRFIPTQNSNYAEIEAIARELGKVK